MSDALCRCGRRPKPGRKCCAKCIQKELDRRARLFAKGLCVNCMQPRDGVTARCGACREVVALKDQNRRTEAAKNGRCQFCPRGRTRGVYCDVCYDAVRKRDRERRKSTAPFKPRRCAGCGELGHYARTCPKARRLAA